MTAKELRQHIQAVIYNAINSQVTPAVLNETGTSEDRVYARYVDNETEYAIKISVNVSYGPSEVHAALRD